VLAGRYHEDDPGSPWRYVLYVDGRGTPAQRASLEAIFTGDRGGTPYLNFPWVFKPSELLAVHAADLEIEHTRAGGRFRVRDDVVVRIDRPAGQPEPVTCLIPGHDSPGTEVVAELMRIGGEAGRWELRGRCGFRTAFSYSG
jgi:hypothetical protein